MEQRTAPPVPTSLYRYYDEHGILLYVGITSRGVTRNREHNVSKEWWGFVARQEVEHFDTRPQAARREAELIRRHTPPFNKQHNPAHDNARATYLAFVNAPAVDLSVEDMRKLRKRLPLIPVPSGNPGEIVLRSLPDHHEVVERILPKPSQEGALVSTRTRKRAGQIASIQHLGTMLVVKIAGKHIPDDLERAQATLTVVQQKPLSWRISKVFVYGVGERDA